MHKLLVPTLLAAISLTNVGCYYGCYGEYIEPAPAQARIAKGHWSLSITDAPETFGACSDIDVEGLDELHAFVQHRGPEGLMIDIEGIVTVGAQHGPDVFTYGAVEDEDHIEVEEEAPEPCGDEDEGDTEEGYDGDGDGDCGEESDGRDGAPPPCEVEEDDEEEPISSETPESGAAVTLSALAEGKHWMSGTLLVDLYAGGERGCSVVFDFEGHHIAR